LSSVSDNATILDSIQEAILFGKRQRCSTAEVLAYMSAHMHDRHRAIAIAMAELSAVCLGNDAAIQTVELAKARRKMGGTDDYSY
jgi:hypothetical protein